MSTILSLLTLYLCNVYYLQRICYIYCFSIAFVDKQMCTILLKFAYICMKNSHIVIGKIGNTFEQNCLTVYISNFLTTHCLFICFKLSDCYFILTMSSSSNKQHMYIIQIGLQATDHCVVLSINGETRKKGKETISGQ